MDRIYTPAQTVELRLDSGAWVNITTAVEGFVVPSWCVEASTGEIICDQVRARVIVPLLEELGVNIRQVLEAGRIDFRLFFHEATSSMVPVGATPVFRGRVVELARLTKLRAGDTLDLTVNDLLKAGNERQPSASILTDTEPARYDAVIRELAAEMDLTPGEFHGTGFRAGTPYITHHPRPGGADAAVQIRGLAWWPVHGMLLCGVNERIWGYEPSTGASYELARPLFSNPVRQIEHLWVDGTDVYGVSLPTPDATATLPCYIVRADLSGFDPHVVGPPVTYTLYADEPFRLWNAGRATVRSQWASWANKKSDRLMCAGNAIGLAGPEMAELSFGDEAFHDGNRCVKPRAYHIKISAEPGVQRVWTTDAPGILGRNLYLSEETEVSVRFLESDERQEKVKVYRMPGPLAYFIPTSALAPNPSGETVLDYGNGRPYAELVGELPMQLPAGYYAFVNSGSTLDTSNLDSEKHYTLEQVSSFEVGFSRLERRPSTFHTSDGGHVITAEDDVDISALDEPLGPLLSLSGDEFERLYHRDLATGTRVEVTGFPAGAYLVHLTRVSATEGYAVFAREVGLPGAYGRQDPLVKLEVGRVYSDGGTWRYRELGSLGGRPDVFTDIEKAVYHYYPTSVTRLGNRLYVGYYRTCQRFVEVGNVRVHTVQNVWDTDERSILDFTIVDLSGYYMDEFKAGDRIRLWPDDIGRFPYAPLPRTVQRVEWVNERWTQLLVAPELDCSDGALNPDDRKIPWNGPRSLGIEEYHGSYPEDFEWGPPTMQREAGAREVRTYFRAFNLSTLSWGAPIDFGREDVSEDLTAEDDPENQRTTLSLSHSFPDTTTIGVTLGGSPISFTVDTDGLYETGDCVLALPRRYAGLELTVTYSYWDVSQRFTEAATAGSTVYYTRGKELRSWSGSVTEHGEVHYKASGVASPLVIPSAMIPVTVYGVAEGGGNYPFQLSVNHSLNVGDRSGWSGKGLASCLAEVALALGCIFWVDGSGVIHFVPRGWRGGGADVLPADVLDYQEPGAWQRAAPAVTVSWPGGAQTAGVLSATRITDNESFSAPLVTSAGWANLLANLLYAAKGNRSGRAEVTLAGLRLDIETGMGLHVPLSGAISPDDGIGVVVGIEPQLNLGEARTRFTLELED